MLELQRHGQLEAKDARQWWTDPHGLSRTTPKKSSLSIDMMSRECDEPADPAQLGPTEELIVALAMGIGLRCIDILNLTLQNAEDLCISGERHHGQGLRRWQDDIADVFRVRQQATAPLHRAPKAPDTADRGPREPAPGGRSLPL